MNGVAASPPAGWIAAGRNAYAITHALPLAYAYRRRYGRPMPLWRDGGATPLPGDLVRPVGGWQVFRAGARVLCLDIPTLVRFGLLGRQCAFLYHALIGKGALHRAGKPHVALRLARDLLFPEPELFSSFPPAWRGRCRACGHLPGDWPGLPLTLLPENARHALARWQAAPQPRVLLLATRGPLSAWDSFAAILAAPPALSFGVKRHPALARVPLPGAAIDLADVPVPLLAGSADLVVGDHSSATLEALRCGRPVAAMETEALRALEAGAPTLPELAYLHHVPRLGTTDILRSLLAAPSAWPTPRAAAGSREPAADGILELLARMGW